MASGSNPLNDLYQQAAAATRAASGSFYFATRFFPLDLAHSAHAVYWFCHYTRTLPRADLDQWLTTVTGGLRGRMARHPVIEVFLDTVERCSIPRDLPLELIEGVRMDRDQTRYQSFWQLRGRCHRFGGVVSLMMAYVSGYRDPALEYMADLGEAIELTTLLRDTGEHLARGYIYLPLEDMAECGYSEDELTRQVRNDAFNRLMKLQVERARGFYESAQPGIALLDPRGRFAVRVAFDLYRQTLARVEASGYDVFRRRPAVPVVERYWITARQLAGPITRRLWRTMSA
jgi:phytoene synthase